MPDLAEPSETWLLHRVAHAVEAGEASGDLLTDLRTEMERAKELFQEEEHALAVQDIAVRLGLPVDQVETVLATLEARPAVTRELVLWQIVEAWLVGQRRADWSAGSQQ